MNTEWYKITQNDNVIEQTDHELSDSVHCLFLGSSGELSESLFVLACSMSLIPPV